jgi:hypothetical protein
MAKNRLGLKCCYGKTVYPIYAEVSDEEEEMFNNVNTRTPTNAGSSFSG